MVVLLPSWGKNKCRALTTKRTPENSPHRVQWRGSLMFSLICAWANCWVNNRDAGDLRRRRDDYGVTIHYAFIWSSYHIILSVMAYQPIMLLLTMHIAHIYSLKSYQSHHHSIQLSFHKSIASWHFCAHTHHVMPCEALLCRTTWISISLLDCIKLCDVIWRGKIVNIISNHIIHHTQLFQEVHLILTWFHISFVYRTW